MNRARMHALLDRIIANANEVKNEIDRAPPATEPALIYMTVEAYAARAAVSTATIRKWICLGLPVIRQGSILRVRVAEADVWGLSRA